VPVTTTSRARFLESSAIFCLNPGENYPPFYAGYDRLS
jgi:hypothetical protein